MGTHYNAFISYRHHPDDIRVASEIHRSLEHFKVPKAIAKKTKGISRLFRDKEELPITSNLTQDITTALENSDYLIVICSVHTKESVWVQREIDLFLKTHDRSRVLTVLASGEPYDVIPEIILHDDVPDPATGELKRVVYEPLSCDWRLPRRQARREELPRLAAALLGCSYDDLRQRQRQYRTRRLIAVFSAALTVSVCLSAYFLYTSITIRKANERIQEANIQIKANYDNALRSQSQYLASAAQARLDAGDRLAAIALSMAALPSQENVRPYVPEAELVLSNALNLYKKETDVEAIASFSPGDSIVIQEFRVTDDGAILYILDNRGIITAWDANTAEKLGTITRNGESIYQILTTAENNLLLIAEDTDAVRCTSLFCFRPDGTLVWKKENCTEMALLDSRDSVIAMEQSSLLLLDAADGEQLRTAIPLPAAENGKERIGFLQETYPAQWPISIKYKESYFTGPDDLYNRAEDIAMVDLNTGTVSWLEGGSSYISLAYTSSDGRLYTESSDTTNENIGYVYNMRLTSPCQSVIRCYDIQDMRFMWETEITSYTYTGYLTLEQIPGRKQLLCASGNAFYILDSETGEVAARCEAGSNILYAAADENTATAVLEDGYLCLYYYDPNCCDEIHYFDGNLKQADICGGGWGLKMDGTQVTLYASSKNDPLWETALQQKARTVVLDSYTSGNHIALTYYDDFGETHVCMLSPEDHRLLWDRNADGAQVMGFLADGSKLILAEEDSLCIAVDVLSGKASSMEFPLSKKQAGNLKYSAKMVQGCLYWINHGTQEIELICWDLNTQKASAYPFAAYTEVWPDFELVGVCQRSVWIRADDGRLLELDRNTGESVLLGDAFPEKTFVAAQEDGKTAAICAGNEILLTGPDSASAVRIQLDAANVVSAYFQGDQLLIICDDGFLHRYGSNGAELSRTELALYAATSFKTVDSETVSWYPINHSKMLVQIDGIGTVIDCGSWEPIACIPEFVGYSQADDCVLCETRNGVAAFPVYDTQNLLEIAGKQLKGYQLTPEQKADYGIES